MLLLVALGVVVCASLLIVLYDLKLRKRLQTCVLTDPSKKGRYPDKIPFVGDPIVELLKFLYSAIIKHQTDYDRQLALRDAVHPELKSVIGQFLGRTFILSWNPEIGSQIYYDKQNFGKVVNSSGLFYTLSGQSVVNAQGARWKFQRKILNPCFSYKRIQSLVPDFIRITDGLCSILDEQIKETGKFEPHYWLSRATLDGLGSAGFGLEFDSLHSKLSEVYSAYEAILQGFTNPLRFVSKTFLKLPLKSNKDFLAGTDNFWKWAKITLDHKRKSLEEHPDRELDILDSMIIAHADSEGLSDVELMQNVFIFFLAGHETTSGTLTFILDFLARHPDVQNRCREEINEKIQGNPTHESVKQLNYITNVINETLRLRCPVVALGRQALRDCELAGYFIPKGTVVSTAVTNLHLDPDTWENPEKFNPDRWNGKSAAPGLNYMPFGLGERVCLGMKFADLEMRIILSKLLQRYEFSVDSDLILSRGITLRPKPGYLLKISQCN